MKSKMALLNPVAKLKMLMVEFHRSMVLDISAGYLHSRFCWEREMHCSLSWDPIYCTVRRPRNFVVCWDDQSDRRSKCTTGLVLYFWVLSRSTRAIAKWCDPCLVTSHSFWEWQFVMSACAAGTSLQRIRRNTRQAAITSASSRGRLQRRPKKRWTLSSAGCQICCSSRHRCTCRPRQGVWKWPWHRLQKELSDNLM